MVQLLLLLNLTCLIVLFIFQFNLYVRLKEVKELGDELEKELLKDKNRVEDLRKEVEKVEGKLEFIQKEIKILKEKLGSIREV